MIKSNLPDLLNCSIAIIGLGYVGLPLAKTIAKNKKCLVSGQKVSRKIIGYDSDKNRINQLIEEISNQKTIVFDLTNKLFAKNIFHL